MRSGNTCRFDVEGNVAASGHHLILWLAGDDRRPAQLPIQLDRSLFGLHAVDGHKITLALPGMESHLAAHTIRRAVVVTAHVEQIREVLSPVNGHNRVEVAADRVNVEYPIVFRYQLNPARIVSQWSAF